MQQTFTDMEYANRKHKTKRDEFLKIMEKIIPWDEWIELIKPYYFDNKVGRPARGIEIMLRMLLLQAWFNLSDEGVEDAIYDSYAMRHFMRLDFIQEQTPDATTLCKFRKLLFENNIAQLLFTAIKQALEKRGHIMHGGTIVDATIIEAPSSTKNQDKCRDPEMHQSKKGNEWHFGMKAHVGVDAGTGYVHTVTATAANVHDITEAHKLFREDDEFMSGDNGYQGIEKREEIVSDAHKSKMEYRISQRPSKIRKIPEGFARAFEESQERHKSSMRSKVEHIFLFIKKQFVYRKTVYKGIAKNLHRLMILFCSANLLMCARSGGWRSITSEG
jgi:IS5 family transposase